MNKSIYIFALLFTASTFFISCDSEDPHVSVTGISLNEMELTMTVGDPAVTLIATVRPNNATDPRVAWESSDTDVATVNANGVVTAVTAGTATITATTADGNFTATCEVTVTPAPILVTGITITDRNPIRLAVGATDRFSHSITPSNATNRAVTWSSNHPNIATVDAANGTITALATGTTTITVTTQCGSRTATGAVTVEALNVSSSIDGVVIDGIRWATRNVNTPGSFAQHPHDAGMFFQWNRRQSWASIGTVTDWDSTMPTGTAWYAANDPCPTGWRVPTADELRSLNNAGAGWITHNGVNGRIFGTAPNQVFLPTAGYRVSSNGALFNVGAWSFYWSSTPSGTNGAMSLGIPSAINISSTFNSMHSQHRAGGLSVRCVAE